MSTWLDATSIPRLVGDSAVHARMADQHGAESEIGASLALGREVTACS